MNMAKVFATPKEGVLVRHENGKQLDPAGEAVERNSFWLRRSRDGDVTLSDIAPVAPTVEADNVAAVTPIKSKK
jgi:hypothetical protein